MPSEKFRVVNGFQETALIEEQASVDPHLALMLKAAEEYDEIEARQSLLHQSAVIRNKIVSAMDSLGLDSNDLQTRRKKARLIDETIIELGPLAVSTLAELLEDPGVRHSVKLATGKYVIDRILGRPTERTENLSLSLEEANVTANGDLQGGPPKQLIVQQLILAPSTARALHDVIDSSTVKDRSEVGAVTE